MLTCAINLSCTSRRCGAFGFTQQFRKKKSKSPVKLAKHELWHCFLVGAAHVLCKAGSLIQLMQRASQKDKNGGDKHFALRRAHAALQILHEQKELLCLKSLLPRHLRWSTRNETSCSLVSFESRSCLHLLKVFPCCVLPADQH